MNTIAAQEAAADAIARLSGSCGPLRATLSDSLVEVRAVPSKQRVLTAQTTPAESLLLLDGLAACVKQLPTGVQQTVGFRLPGEFLDLGTLVSPVLDYSVVPLTRCNVAVWRRKELAAAVQGDAELAVALWRRVVETGMREREWMVNLGRRSAVEGLAYILCTAHDRLRTQGLATADSFAFAATQRDLGDALGLSVVHVNRSLQQLRQSGCLTTLSGVITIKDAKQLRRLAGLN